MVRGLKGDDVMVVAIYAERDPEVDASGAPLPGRDVAAVRCGFLESAPGRGRRHLRRQGVPVADYKCPLDPVGLEAVNERVHDGVECSLFARLPVHIEDHQISGLHHEHLGVLP
eukprot:9502826-Pyramimonas_sp.AAC.1